MGHSHGIGLNAFFATSTTRRAPFGMRCYFAIILVAACGGSTMNGAPTDAQGGDAHGGDHDAPSSTETKTGMLTIESTRYTVSTTEIEQGFASGTFYRIPPVMGSGGGGGCNSATYGACTVQTCTFAPSPTDAGTSMISYTDAGPIAISGVQVNDGTMTLTPGGYSYATVSGAVALFNGGDTVRWVAPGNPNGAPAFDVSLVAPSSVPVTAPTFDHGMVVVSGSHDLNVAWTGASPTDVTAQLTAGTTGESAIARCTFPGGSAGGVVPAAAIAAVRAVGGNASIMVMGESSTTRNPDGWNITFALESYGVVSSGVAVATLSIQ
jgi:hypothetical protein